MALGCDYISVERSNMAIGCDYKTVECSYMANGICFNDCGVQ